MPIVSVVVPVFNAEKYIRECLDSIIAQTIFGQMEIIAVDDGSFDSSPRILDEYAATYDSIAVIHQPNSGVSAARNAGINAAKGEFVGFVDGDDTVYPEMYEKLCEAAATSGADAAVCGIFHPYPDKDVTITYPFDCGLLLDREYIEKNIAPFMLRDSSFNSVCNKIFRREILSTNGLLLSVGKKQGEDREFVLKFLNLCRGLCCTDYVGYYYRNVPSSAIQKPRFDYVDTIFSQCECDRQLFAKLSIEGEAFDKPSSIETANVLMSALAFANNKLCGKSRHRVMNSIVSDSRTSAFLSEQFELLVANCSQFDRLILGAMKKKSILQIRIIMALMKIKVFIYNKLKG